MSRSKGPRSSPTGKPLLVLVTGAAGQQGGHVARALLARGHRVRALSRKPDSPKLQELLSKGVDVVAGAFDDPAAVGRAARGVDAMFLMGTSFEAGPTAETRQGVAAVDAAKDAGVPWLVYSSVADADRGTGIPHFESKFAVEEHLRRSGLPHAVSAPTSFMENLLAPFSLPGLRQGKIASGIAPGRGVQSVALDDLGAFVTHLIEHPSKFGGKRINVASDLVTGTEQARILSELTGRAFEYQQIPLEVLRQQNADYAKMFEWFERAGYTADIEGLRRDYPGVGWHRFREWATQHDWARLLG
jgi:uncharacterized protein YbjT (DUF2867 family)